MKRKAQKHHHKDMTFQLCNSLFFCLHGAAITKSSSGTHFQEYYYQQRGSSWLGSAVGLCKKIALSSVWQFYNRWKLLRHYPTHQEPCKRDIEDASTFCPSGKTIESVTHGESVSCCSCKCPCQNLCKLYFIDPLPVANIFFFNRSIATWHLLLLENFWSGLCSLDIDMSS